MPQIGGKPKKASSDSKRHFTVVMGGKEHGLYVSSTPSSAAKKAVTKLCAANKSKKVEFSIREITQGSKKKTYGPYKGYIEKLKEPIELKGRVIKYKPVAKLGAKKGVQKGGDEFIHTLYWDKEYKVIHKTLVDDKNFLTAQEKDNLGFNKSKNKFFTKATTYLWMLYPEGFKIFNHESDKNEEAKYYYGILRISPSSLFKIQSIYIAFQVNISKKKKDYPNKIANYYNGRYLLPGTTILSETIIELNFLAKGIGKEEFKQKLLQKMVDSQKIIKELIELIKKTNTTYNQEFSDLQNYFKQNIQLQQNHLETQKPVMNSKNHLEAQKPVMNSKNHLKAQKPVINSKELKNMVNKLHPLNNDVYLNIALKFMLKRSIVFFANFLNKFTKYNNIISVGSGNGYFEYLLEAIFDINIICIDPKPNSFLKKNNSKLKEVKYSTVDKFLEVESSEDCLLILNWPSPNNINNDDNDDNDNDDNDFKSLKLRKDYDVEAIEKLKPIGIFMIYEGSGVAGSEEFHKIRPIGKADLLELEIANKTKLVYEWERDEFIANIFGSTFDFLIDSYTKKN
jgi:hypothetical protein